MLAFQRGIDFRRASERQRWSIDRKKRIERRAKAEDMLCDTLIPAMSNAVTCLSSSLDKELALALFRLVVEYKNSADESFGWELVRWYLARPGDSELALQGMDTLDQKDILDWMPDAWLAPMWQRGLNN